MTSGVIWWGVPFTPLRQLKNKKVLGYADTVVFVVRNEANTGLFSQSYSLPFDGTCPDSHSLISQPRTIVVHHDAMKLDIPLQTIL